jgi:hypothetical protein
MSEPRPGKQAMAVEMFAAGGHSLAAIAAVCDVHEKTVARWRKNPAFNDAVITRARELLKENLPDIYTVLGNLAKEGSHQHIRLLLEHLERIEEMRNNAMFGQVTFTWKQGVVQAPPSQVDVWEDEPQGELSEAEG